MSTCSASPIRIERIAGLQSHHLGRSSPEKPPPDEKQDPGSSMLLSSCRSDLQALRASSASSADAGIPSDSIIRRGQKQSGNADEAAPLAASATAELRDQCCNKPRSHQAVDVTVMASAETHHGSTTVNNAATETQTKEVNHVISQKGTQNSSSSPTKQPSEEAPIAPSPSSSCSSGPGSPSPAAAPPCPQARNDNERAPIADDGGCNHRSSPSSSSPSSPTTTPTDCNASDHTASNEASLTTTPASPLSPSGAACTKLKPDAPSFTPTPPSPAAAASTRMSAYGVRLRIVKPCGGGGGSSPVTADRHSPDDNEEEAKLIPPPLTSCSPADKPRHDRPHPSEEAMIQPLSQPRPEAAQVAAIVSFDCGQTADASGDGACSRLPLPVHPHAASEKQLLGMVDGCPPQDPLVLTGSALPPSPSVPSVNKSSPFTAQTSKLQQQQQQLLEFDDSDDVRYLGPADATPSAATASSNPRPPRPALLEAPLPAAPPHHHQLGHGDHADEPRQQQPRQLSMSTPSLVHHQGAPSSRNSSHSTGNGGASVVPPLFEKRQNRLPVAHSGDGKHPKRAASLLQLPGSSSSSDISLEAACGFRPASAPPGSTGPPDTADDDGISSAPESEAGDVTGSADAEACSAASAAQALKASAGHHGAEQMRAGMEGGENHQSQSETPSAADASAPLVLDPLLHLNEGTVEEALWILEQAQATSCVQAPSHNHQNQHHQQQQQLLLLEAMSTAAAAAEAKAAVMPLPQSMSPAMMEAAGQQAYYGFSPEMQQMQMHLYHEMQKPNYQLPLPPNSAAPSIGNASSLLGQTSVPSAPPVAPQQQQQPLQTPASAAAPTRTAPSPLPSNHLQHHKEAEPIRQPTSAMMPHSSGFSGVGNSHCSASCPALLKEASPSIMSTATSNELPFYPDAFLGSEGITAGAGGGLLTLEQWQLAAGLGPGPCLPHHLQQQQQQQSPSPSQQQVALSSPFQQHHNHHMMGQPLPPVHNPMSSAEALLMSSLPQLHQQQHQLPPISSTHRGSSSPSADAAAQQEQQQQQQQQRHLQQLQQLQQETELIMSRLGLGMGPHLTQQQQQQLMQLQTGDQDAAGAGSAAPTSSKQHSLYKTELCRSWSESGSCRYGSKCQFAHGPEELRHIQRHPKYKTEICRTFATTGTCPYGARCRFIHCSASQGDTVVDSQQQQLMMLLEQQQAEGGLHMPNAADLQQQQQPPPQQQQILSYYPSFAAGSNSPSGMTLPSGGTVFPPQQLPTETMMSSTPSCSAATSAAAMPPPGSLQALLDQTLAPRTPPQQTASFAGAGASLSCSSKTAAPMQQHQQRQATDVVAPPGPFVRLQQDCILQPASALSGSTAASASSTPSSGHRDRHHHQHHHHHQQQQLQNLGFQEISLSPDSVSSEATAASPGSPPRRLPIFAGLLDSIPPFDLYKALP